MTITDHAIMRYAQRCKQEPVYQEIFKSWKQSNPEKLAEYEKEIREKYKKAEFLVSGKYDRAQNQSNFYLLNDENLIFVTNADNLILLTLYELDYGVAKDGNNVILNLLLKELDNLKNKKKEYEDLKADKLTGYDREKKTLEMRKAELKAELQEIEAKQQLINKDIEFANNRAKTIESGIENTYRKIVRSIEF